MDLTGTQWQELQDALINAFPQRPQLAAMVQKRLGMNLNAIAGDPDLEPATFQLIQWAISHGRLPDLINGATQSNPGNPLLQTFVAGLGSTAGPKARPPA
ncbi:MAG: effector-associated domain EAD1-containing protein [Chloroflexia bacterium]